MCSVVIPGNGQGKQMRKACSAEVVPLKEGPSLAVMCECVLCVQVGERWTRYGAAVTAPSC